MSKKPLTTKPTRAQLLTVIYELQSLIGSASAAYDNDRAHDRADRVQEPLKKAFNLCIDTTRFDPPQ